MDERIKKLIEESGGDKLSVGELALAAGYAELTIRRYVSEGRIPSFKMGGRRYIRRADALNFLKGTKDI